MKKSNSCRSHVKESLIQIPVYLILIALLALSACTKSGGPGGTGSGGKGTLLAKEVIVGKDVAGVQVDSVVFALQYGANNNLSELQQDTWSQLAGNSVTISLTYQFTYSGNLVSSFTGNYSQTIKEGGQTYNSADQLNTTFYATGGQVTSYLQLATLSGAKVISPTTVTGNDSALLSYDANGNVSRYTIYEKNQGAKKFTLYFDETFSYSGGNLAQTINFEYVLGIPLDTVTTVYTYNGKLSAAPVQLVPGVNINNINDISSFTRTTVGAVPSTNVTTYQTTYNSSNQPVSSIVTVMENPFTPETLASETITYSYQ
jgi:hypothetical protein